jgi:uncharacterized NAD-dependent epimerase/dehydratase family protein
MEGALGDPSGKMGYGVLRYAPYEVACVIDSVAAGADLRKICGIPRRAPIVASVEQARALGANVFLLGIAPAGGAIPSEWFDPIDRAVAFGMRVVNGLHDRLALRYPGKPVWDVRVEPEGLGVGTGAARNLAARRVLFIGTDMACGKMTAGLETLAAARAAGRRCAFVATGQIGITITGAGVPLDAVRVDFASGAIEREMMRHADAEVILVEGQGALIHPASTANLPLLRGSCPTDLVLCHRAGQTELCRVPWVRIPPLDRYVELYQQLAEAVDTFPRPRLAGVALNTAHLTYDEARAACAEAESLLSVPCVDPVRDGAARLLDAVLD